ncbi:MAG: acyltransferase [Myxococcaceae bacterium]
MDASAAPNTRTTHWANVGEAGFALGTWILYFVHRTLGRWPFRVILAPVLFYYVLRHPIARSASKDYFQRLGYAPSTWRSYKHIFGFAETLLDKVLAVARQYPFKKIRFTGRDVMVDSMAQKKGGVLITAHMGCLEVCRLAAEKKDGPRLNVLVHTGNAERFNQVLKRLDPETQVKLIQVTDVAPSTAAMLAEKVDAGEFVVIAGDRVPLSDASGRTVSVPFLGTEAHFPIGPWVLASALKCQVIMFSVLREDDTYRVRFEKLADQVSLPRGKREEGCRQYATLFAQKLEQLCRAAPFDWFNFYPFWEPPRA